MAIPDFQTLMLPILEFAADGQEHGFSEAIEKLARRFQLTEAEREERLPSGRQARFDNRVGWSSTYLRKAGLLQALGRGRFQITPRGSELLAKKPDAINLAFLSSTYPEIVQFRSRKPDAEDEAAAVFDSDTKIWGMRLAVQERFRESIESLLPEEGVRKNLMELLARVIESADQERSGAWLVRETASGLRIMAGRLLACELRRRTLRLSVLGPDDEACKAIGSDLAEAEELKFIPGAVLLEFPVERARVATDRLMDAIDRFIDGAMARVVSSVSLEAHDPEIVACIAAAVERDLPQPLPAVEEGEGLESGGEDEGQGVAIAREPRVRGRAPIFEPGQRSIASLVSDIERDVIALPDMQRPFVWEDTKVRDLLDSLFVGFPVGTLVLWHTGTEEDARALGTERPNLRASTLVIDGQQRLTSLYAVMKDQPVMGKDHEDRKITISFRPRDGRFEVADAAIRNDPEFLHSVSELWKGPRSKPQIRRDLITVLRDGGRAVDTAYEDAVERNLDRAHSIGDYRLPTVDIRKTAGAAEGEATDEDVAEIFVRINNQGTRLGQADFVLTLLAVFHPSLRDRIQERARLMSEGALVALDTQQLLRAACAVAFSRARMSAVYRSLRGVDANTGEADASNRKKRLDRLDQAADECMSLTVWRDYLLRVGRAGFVTSRLIASKSAIVNAFALYVRGRKMGVVKHELDELASRWVFGVLLTARYSGSSETIFERDLKRLDETSPNDPAAFIQCLDQTLDERITGDYWSRALVAALDTQKARSPAALAFRAAQVVLGARALFSDQPLQNLLDPPAQGGRSASEVHHLYPEAWLNAHGVRDRRRINQVANLADTGWHENTTIGAKGPADYVPRFRDRLRIDDDEWGRMCAEHALPVRWEKLEYAEFLIERRRRMAEIIRTAYRTLGGERDAAPIEPPWFVGSSESIWKSIVAAERALRGLVRGVYTARFGAQAAQRIEQAFADKDKEQESLARALRSRPAGADPLSIIDYLYLGQLPPLVFRQDVWSEASTRLGGRPDAKQKLQEAIAVIAPVRNEIAHVREVSRERLMRAELACNDILSMVGSGGEHLGRY